VTSKFTLRGGHRYTWGDAVLRAPQLSQSGTRESGRLRMHAGIAGAQIRPLAKFTVNLDYEGSPGDANYFRTSLQNYHLAKARTRWQPRTDLFFSATFQVLDNRNPAAGVEYEFRNRSASAAIQWMPRGGRHASVLAEYTRSALRSDIFYLVPLGLTPERSLYRDNGHTATTAVDLNLPGITRAPQLTLGGSLFQSSGSRPTRYYMPFGRISLPLQRTVSGYAEWRWYGFSQPFFLFETFRSHQFQIGFRLSM
jgi:hypothetical protein